MATTKLTGTLIRTGSIPTIALGGGVVTSSAQITNLLPTGTVSSSAQVAPLLPGGTVSSSTQVVAGVSAQTITPASITTTGNVAIGTTNTNTRLAVSGNTNITGSLAVSASLAVGNITPSATVGRIDAANDVVAFSTSDARLKENITPIQFSLDKVGQLNGVEFNWKQDPDVLLHHGYGTDKDYGLIAQDVEAIFPEMVQTRDNGFKAVRYERLIPVLVEAIKTLKAEVDDLKNSK